ncbi:ATP-binding protein [Rubrimonas sp.]|uniref:ATP-binding protein n=1 Tax=Rubrimonas sp. TaxID=2036015 RepID=UPI002FDD628D
MHEPTGRSRLRSARIVLTLSKQPYPIAGHWAWGGLLDGTQAGWLEARGFVDFAGSTVVHSVGGWVALAAVLRLGPREGRFDGRHGIEADNLALSAGGGLLLWIGWLGFNGGSLLAFEAEAASILLATTLAAAAGGTTAIALCLRHQGRVDAMAAINGVVGGLVAITASAHLAGGAAAILVGALGGLTARVVGAALERGRIDDAVGAISAHLGAGIVGTIAVAFVASPDGASLIDRLATQALGVAAIGAWSFGVAWPALRLIGRIWPLRATREAEAIGLNVAEHGAGSALYDLLGAMEVQRVRGDFSLRAPIEPGTEAGVIAAQYNRVLGRVEDEIGARERMAATLERARDEAQAGNAAKSRFLATMSHEIRTPLNGVLGMADLLAHTPLDDKQSRMLSTIRASGDILLTTIGDILDAAKLETGALQLEVAPVDLAEIASLVRDIHAGAAERKGLAIALRIRGERLRRLGDAHRIQQVLHNLVSNAVKFTERGAVGITVEASQTDRVTITVADEGVGMTVEQAARVFEPFTQADESITRRFGGTGLGLSIVRLLVDAMGGRIDLETAPGAGAVFAVTLPLAVAEEAARPVVEPAAIAAAAELAGMRVLAADDNAINRMVLAGLLKQLSVDCVMVEGGAEVIAAFETGGVFDAILLDISMPQIDGCAAMRAIRDAAARSVTPPPPIIACTASVMPDEIRQFLREGFDDHLAKPLTSDALRQTLCKAARAPAACSRPAAGAPEGAATYPRGSRSEPSQPIHGFSPDVGKRHPIVR